MQIAFLGDSLTQGWPGAAYLPLLKQWVPSHELLNLGRAGDTVAALLRRVTRRGLDPVDLAFVWVGANDAVVSAWDAEDDLGGDRSWAQRLDHLRADYETLMHWTAARAARLVCVRPLVLEADGSIWQERADQVGDVVAHLVGARDGARTLDLRPAFAAAAAQGGGPFSIDGVHFTDAGATVVAASFAVVIEEVERRTTSAAGQGDRR